MSEPIMYIMQCRSLFGPISDDQLQRASILKDGLNIQEVRY